MRNIIVKNTGLSDIDWGGRTYPASSQYNIEVVDKLRLISDPNFLNDLSAGIAVVNDTEYDLPERIALGVLSDDTSIMNEYYTLIQDSGVLTGNGQILHLHEELWAIDDSDIEDDVPTED